jgi:hypothetical protein
MPQGLTFHKPPGDFWETPRRTGTIAHPDDFIVNYLSHFVKRNCEKYFTFYLFLLSADNPYMEGLTIAEMADLLKLEPHTVAIRLNRAGIKPKTKDALYDPSALEVIRNVPGKGRPAKKPDTSDKEP